MKVGNYLNTGKGYLGLDAWSALDTVKATWRVKKLSVFVIFLFEQSGISQNKLAHM